MRKIGIAGIQKDKIAQAKYRDKGLELAEDQLQQMSKQMETFKGNLEEFAGKYKNDIRKNPQFRKQFQEMCSSIGVDPLASGKGFWSEMLGVGDFYYELGVQIVEVCLATSHRNGGLIYLDELNDRLVKSRGRNNSVQEISTDDLLRAIKKLKVLGNGFSVFPVGNGRYLVQSIPGELSMDHTTVFQHSMQTGYTTKESLTERLKWTDDRSTRCLTHMIKIGLAWIDDQSQDGITRYYFPALFSSANQ